MDSSLTAGTSSLPTPARTRCCAWLPVGMALRSITLSRSRSFRPTSTRVRRRCGAYVGCHRSGRCLLRRRVDRVPPCLQRGEHPPCRPPRAATRGLSYRFHSGHRPHLRPKTGDFYVLEFQGSVIRVRPAPKGRFGSGEQRGYVRALRRGAANHDRERADDADLRGDRSGRRDLRFESRHLTGNRAGDPLRKADRLTTVPAQFLIRRQHRDRPVVFGLEVRDSWPAPS